MNTRTKEKFVRLWERYFPGVELPVAFFYSDETHGAEPAAKPAGHSCLIAKLLQVRQGTSLLFNAESVGCGGGRRYLGFAETINDRFAYFLSDGSDGGRCERYKKTPALVEELMRSLPYLKPEGRNLVFKRWDKLEADDHPCAVIFFATPDVVSGLFTLAVFDNNRPDAVMTPFGAGCTSMVYYPYAEHLAGRRRAVLGLFDPSARKCVKDNLLSFSMPIAMFETMIDNMEQSFLITDAWTVMQKRIAVRAFCGERE